MTSAMAARRRRIHASKADAGCIHSLRRCLTVQLRPLEAAGVTSDESLMDYLQCRMPAERGAIRYSFQVMLVMPHQVTAPIPVMRCK